MSENSVGFQVWESVHSRRQHQEGLHTTPPPIKTHIGPLLHMLTIAAVLF